MAECLIALGSNLGDRACAMRQAVAAIARLPQTRVVARSAWRETPPVGGPAGQGPFLNGAVLAHSDLDASALVAELLGIETRYGRVRNEHWGARTIDLDLLLRGDEASCDNQALAVVPHPRMHYRRFVLEGAAEVAPWMIHPTSQWTLARLLAQLDAGAPEAAIAGEDVTLADELAARVNERIAASGPASPRVRRWDGGGWNPGPRVLMAASAPAGQSEATWRKMLHLPPTGPVTWLNPGSLQASADEAWTVMTSVWPELGPIGTGT